MMARVHFKDLEVSELAKEVVLDRLADAETRFPDLRRHRVSVVLSMENSPRHPGPDVFGVKINITGFKFKDLILEKKAPSLYLASAQVHEALLERLNRFTDKMRVRRRARARKFGRKSVLGRAEDPVL